jgi:hypothetical protein
MERKREMIRELTSSAIGVIEHYIGRLKSRGSARPRGQTAQELAATADRVNEVRFGEQGLFLDNRHAPENDNAPLQKRSEG